ncbi:MAG: MGMT family protein [Anaerolineae bacterium]|jgi:methylated-DNA-protein-cysteine methyltransferase-like protein|nr:MGMT family protein [Anaerolineae bacterium]
MNSFFHQVYRVVRLIPPGQVATYGQIARILGAPRAARTVGWALHDLPEGSDVPWQRVVNARGAISLERRGLGGAVQRALLEEEGVRFGPEGQIDLAVYGWPGPDLAEVQSLRSPLGGEASPDE